MTKTPDKLRQLLYFCRNKRSAELFSALRKYSKGKVLDIGGASFFNQAKDRLNFTSWTSLEPSDKYAFKSDDPRYRLMIGDGCDMKFSSGSFDTVLCIQVLEHVLEPNKMMAEISRVLKKGGNAIILVPQTGNLHMVPHHYFNFTQYWLKSSGKSNGLKIVRLKPLGGFWSSSASRSFYFLLQSLNFEGFTYGAKRRRFSFYLLLPIAWAWAILNILVGLLLSTGDLQEEANNHLAVLKK